MTNAAPSAIYSLLLPNLLYSSRFLCCGEDLAERSGATGKATNTGKDSREETFEISNYCRAVKHFIDHLKGPIWPKSKS
jgi:hypothetical protein